MGHHRNAERIRALYAAFAARDLQRVLENLADDAVFHFQPEGPNGGDHKGREAITRALAAGFELTGGTQALEVENVFANDDHAVVVLHETATRTDGATLDMEEVHLLTLDADGKITNLWDLPSDPDVHDAFFAGRP